jgi:importin subunit alpha-1
MMDAKVIEVALNGLDNILKIGQQDSRLNDGSNQYSILIEECGGEYNFCVQNFYR